MLRCFILLVWRRFPIALENMAVPEAPLPAPAPAPSQQNTVASAIRKYFPETWIWSCGLSGLVKIFNILLRAFINY